MLLNLCGAHGPFFTRNIVILKDNAGRCGVGEVPGGEGIRLALERAIPLVIGKPLDSTTAFSTMFARCSPAAARPRINQRYIR